MDDPVYVGVDVSKAALDVAVLPTSESWQSANDLAGIDGLVERIAVLGPALVVLEATGRLAKTDTLNAAVLALFAERVRPEPRPLPDAESAALAAIVARRRQIITMLVAEKNRAHIAAPAVKKRVAKHVRWLARELSGVDDDLHAAIRESAVWRAKDDLLRSVPSVAGCWRRRCWPSFPNSVG